MLSAKNWIGGAGNWSVAANWDPSGVPTDTDDVTIFNGDVTIDIDAFAQSIIFEGNSLTIDGVTLTIDNSAGHGLVCNGGDFLNDGGEIYISNTSMTGILNKGTGSFQNDGSIYIEGITGSYAGIENRADFYNTLEIDIDNVANGSGIYNYIGTQVFKNDGGDIYIASNDNVGGHGIDNRAEFINSGGIISLGSGATISLNSIYNEGDAVKFSNENSSSLNVLYCGTNYAGIDNRSTFSNTGDSEIIFGLDIYRGIDNNNGTFNNTSGTIQNQDAFSESLILNQNGGTFNNSDYIVFSGNTLADKPGIENRATFVNSGIMEIEGVSGQGILNYDASSSFTNTNTGQILMAQNNSIQAIALENNGTFSNLNSLVIGGGGSPIDSQGIYQSSTGSFTNNGGEIFIEETAQQAIYNNGGTFENTNNGKISVGINNPCEDKGIENSGVFNNMATAEIEIDIVSSEAIYTSGGTFSNYGNYIHRFNSYWAIRGVSGSAFINKSTGNIFSGGEIEGDYFTNEGALNPGNSPGRLKINNNFYSNAGSILNIELGGTNPESQYDQIEFYNLSSDDISNTDLVVTYINGFEAGEANCFDIIIGDGYSGTFNSITRPTPPIGFVWVDYYSATKYTMCLEAALPLETIDFTANIEKGSVLLSILLQSIPWTKNIVIQRSTNNMTWKTINTIETPTNNQDPILIYDNSPFQGINYYRLKLENLDGEIEYSYTIQIFVAKSTILYPNPAHDMIKINTSENNDKIILYNTKGEELLLRKISKNTFDVSILDKGIYFYIDGNTVKKIIIN